MKRILQNPSGANEGHQRKKDIPFLIALSYLLSFLTIRLIVYVAGAAHTEFAQTAKIGLTPDVRFYVGRNIIFFGYHIHHFYFGIILICVAGWMALVGSSHFSRKHIAVIYGAGLGLFMDEIGLLLTWGDYFSGLSYLLSIFLIGVFLNIIFFPDFWREVRISLQNPQSHSMIRETLFKNIHVIRLVDWISEKTGQAEKTSLFFTGILSFFLCTMILVFPKFFRYWIFGAFVLQGITHLVRAWKK